MTPEENRKLIEWLEKFEVPDMISNASSEATKTESEIIEKFRGFQKWAKQLIESKITPI